MVQMIFKTLLILLLVSPFPLEAKKEPAKKRKPSEYRCATTSCEKMNLLITNLKRAKEAFDKKVAKVGEGTTPIPNEERVWNAQQSEVYSYVCAFSFDKASGEERETFFKFSRDSHKMMADSVFRLELSQCFYEVVSTHRTESAETMKEAGGESSYQNILKQGKPSMDF